MKELEDLKELLNEEDDNFNKMIEKKMNRKLSTQVYKTIISIGLVIAILLGGGHFLTKMTHYNPHKTNVEFRYLLQSYIWLYYPDVIFRPSFDNEIEDKLFGKYIYNAEFDSRFGSNYLGDNPTNIEIDNSIDLSPLHAISPIWVNKYDRDMDYSYNNSPESKDTLIEELNKLPESTYISATVLFVDAIELEEVIHMMREYKNTDFKWCAIESFKEIQMLNTGIPLQSPSNGYGETLEGYESLLKHYENDIPTITELQERYYDMLDVLLDDKETYNLLINREVNRSYANLSEQRAFANEHLNSIGLKISTNKHDLIKMIQDDNCSFVWIENMKLSKLA